MGTTRSRLVIALLLGSVAVLVAWVHAPALTATTVWFDDEAYVTKNRLVLTPSWESAERFLGEVQFPTSVAGYYQPLTMISLMLDAAAGGRPDHLLPFHRTNFVLHILNTVLVVVLLLLLFDEPFTAALVGLLFGLHPLTVEPITWMGERKTLLATFFALAALCAYVKYARATRPQPDLAVGPRTARVAGWYAAVAACYLLALLSKPTTTPLPLLALLLDYWPLRRSGRRAVVEKIPLFALGLLSAGLTILSQRSDMAVARLFSQLTGGVVVSDAQTVRETILSVCHNIAFYPALIFWPAHLLAFYLPPDPMALTNPAVSPYVIGAGLLFLVALVSLRWTRALWTGWLFFLVALLPATGVIRFTNTVASEKFAYLPSLGFAIVLAWLLARVWRRGHAARWTIGAILLLIAATEARATRRYAQIWHDDESLYGYVLSHSPQAFWVQYDLGDILADKGRMDEALTHYLAAEAGEPDGVDLVEIQQNLGNALFSLGRTQEAVGHYQRVLARQPDNVGVLDDLGLAFLDLGRSDDALATFRKVLALNPSDAVATDGVGRATAGHNAPEQSIASYRAAAEARPESADAHLDLADALQTQGDYDAAIVEYRIALRLAPDNASIHNNLGAALTERERYDEAIAEFQSALRINPGLRDVQTNLQEATDRRAAAGP